MRRDFANPLPFGWWQNTKKCKLFGSLLVFVLCMCVLFYSDLAYALLLLVDGNPANTRTSKHFEGEISYQAKGTLHANWERVLSNSTKAGPFLDANALFVCKLSLSLDTHWLCMYQLVFSLHSLILFTLRETLARSRILHIQTSSRSSL